MNEEELMEKDDNEITADIRKIRQLMERFDKTPFDKELLVVWLHDKSKISKKEIQLIIKLQTDFLQHLVARRL